MIDNIKPATPMFHVRRGEFGSVYVVNSDERMVFQSPALSHDRLAADLWVIIDAYEARIEAQQAETEKQTALCKQYQLIITEQDKEMAKLRTEIEELKSERDVDVVGERDQVAKLLAEATKEIERLNDELQAQAECNRDRASEIERLRGLCGESYGLIDSIVHSPAYHSLLNRTATISAHMDKLDPAALADVKPKVCEYVMQDDRNWRTGCGRLLAIRTFTLVTNEGPIMPRLIYCCECGGEIEIKE